MILTFILTALFGLGSYDPKPVPEPGTNLFNLRASVGQRFRIECPGDSEGGPVWGTGRYSDDSSVCTAAIHFGVINSEKGGSVVIQIMTGTTNLVGTTRNGIKSLARSNAEGSFSFVPKSVWSFEDVKWLDASEAGVERRIATWDSRMLDLRGQLGTRVLVFCPAGERTHGPVWGTDVYSDDSAVCLAGVHAGLITNEGGDFIIEIEGPTAGFIGSTRNGVASHTFGSWPGSFRVIKDVPRRQSDCALNIPAKR